MSSLATYIRYYTRRSGQGSLTRKVNESLGCKRRRKMICICRIHEDVCRKSLETKKDYN